MREWYQVKITTPHIFHKRLVSFKNVFVLFTVVLAYSTLVCFVTIKTKYHMCYFFVYVFWEQMSISAQSSSKRIEIITLTVALNSAKCCQKRTLGGSMHWKKLLYRIMSHQAIHCGASVCMSAKVEGRQNEVFLHCIQMYHIVCQSIGS